VGSMPRGVMDKPIEEVVFKAKKGFVTDPFKRANLFLILKVEDRFEAGQATFDEVKNDIQERLTQPKAEGKVRIFLTQLREDAFLEIKEGYVDSGAAPGKDTRWKDVAQLKAQTTTKEEVAARRKKHILWVIPAGTVKSTKPSGAAAAPASAPTTEPAATTDKTPEKAPDKTPDKTQDKTPETAAPPAVPEKK